MTVPDTGTIADLNVCIQITHTFSGDIKVELSHNSGPPVVLMDRPGRVNPQDETGCFEQDIAVILDDAAPDSVQGGLACPVQGTFYPLQALSAFDGQNINGTWTFTISDNFAEDTGSLTGVELIYTLQ